MAILGLGKFGGRDLGYASDLELQFVYQDDPDTTGERSQHNLKYYSEVARMFKMIIHARREGVFEIDMRLRPYGKDGPLAASVSAYKNYYKTGGEAWNFERQALVKLRFVAGSKQVGSDIEALRDAFVYGPHPFDFKELDHLRTRQEHELTQVPLWNAKYSEGGLLDIEYLVQMLQVSFGQSLTGGVRSPNTLKALRALWQSGVM